MYINPFVLGIICGIVVATVTLFIIGANLNKKGR